MRWLLLLAVLSLVAPVVAAHDALVNFDLVAGTIVPDQDPALTEPGFQFVIFNNISGVEILVIHDLNGDGDGLDAGEWEVGPVESGTLDSQQMPEAGVYAYIVEGGGFEGTGEIHVGNETDPCDVPGVCDFTPPDDDVSLVDSLVGDPELTFAGFFFLFVGLLLLVGPGALRILTGESVEWSSQDLRRMTEDELAHVAAKRNLAIDGTPAELTELILDHQRMRKRWKRSELEALPKEELRGLCELRELKTRGKKSALVERLLGSQPRG